MAVIMRYAESLEDNKSVSYLGFSHGTIRGYETVIYLHTHTKKTHML